MTVSRHHAEFALALVYGINAIVLVDDRAYAHAGCACAAALVYLALFLIAIWPRGPDAEGE